MAIAGQQFRQYRIDMREAVRRAEAAIADAYARTRARIGMPHGFTTNPTTSRMKDLQTFTDLEKARQLEILFIVRLLDEHSDGV